MAHLSAAEWLQQVKTDRVIAVIRTDELSISIKLAEAAIAAGMRHIEITSTSHRFTEAIAVLRERFPEIAIGTGTVVDEQVGKEAIAAGAQFVFSPYFTSEVMELALRQDIAMVPGALTPTEIGTAWRAGATAVKVFPIQSVGGAQYLKALKGPMGYVPLIPTGGVSCENARSFLDAGAIAIGLATHLFPKDLVREQNWLAIEGSIRSFLKKVR
ncbi:MAG: bifunctional 4-hydroxy-2-oxoglutarate aldolase/2-dehydro-3-deoxy-phosphogluconate aldolase [Cyanobacteria bacterium P01_A01_bin.3]